MRRIRTKARYCARWASNVSPIEAPTMRSSFSCAGEEDDVPDVGDGVDDAPGQLRLGLAVDRAQAGDPAPEGGGDRHVDHQPGGQDRREGRLGPEEQHQEQPALGRQRDVVPVGALEQGDRLLGKQHRPMGDLAGQHVVEVGRAVALGVGEDQLPGAGQHRDAAGVGAVPDAPLEHDEGGHHREELNQRRADHGPGAGRVEIGADRGVDNPLHGVELQDRERPQRQRHQHHQEDGPPPAPGEQPEQPDDGTRELVRHLGGGERGKRRCAHDWKAADLSREAAKRSSRARQSCRGLELECTRSGRKPQTSCTLPVAP